MNETPVKNKRKLWKWIAIVVAVGILITIVLCVALVGYTNTPGFEAASTARAIEKATTTAIARETEAAKPTNTQTPTNIPEPTSTPQPTSTITPTPTEALVPTETPVPTPALLTCRDIKQEKKGKTDLQWEVYAREVIGEQIRFAGEVMEVYDDGRVQIDDCGLLTVCILYKIPLDTAMMLNKDQFVEGIGTVREVGTFLTLYVHINVESISAP